MPFLLAGSNSRVHKVTIKGAGQGPVVLIVAAYDALLWDFTAVKERVRAVVASGYYPQAVTGLNATTPIRFSSMIGNFKGSETCGRIHYAYGATTDIQVMASDIKNAIGIRPRFFYGQESSESLDIDGGVVPFADIPDLSEIKAAVPLITEDDPASKAEMQNLPTAAEQAAGINIRKVEWNRAGVIIRDEGGPEATIGNKKVRLWEPKPTAHGRSIGRLVWQWLIYLGIIIFVVWMWRRSRRDGSSGFLHSRSETSLWPSSSTLGQKPSEVEPKDGFRKQLDQLTALASITDSEPLIVAFHRLGKEIYHLKGKRFDGDIESEIVRLVEQHFDHAIAHYIQVRPSLQSPEGESADNLLRPAIERLADRLHELHSQQTKRDISSVDEAARFIDARHPA